MANLFQPSLSRVLDDDGNPINGAKMFFYLTETLTQASWYQDQEATTPGTNPLVSDANGQFSGAYLDPNIVYRIKLTDNTGAATGEGSVYWDIDPVRGYDESSEIDAQVSAAESAAAAAASALSAATDAASVAAVSTSLTALIPIYSTVDLGIAGVSDGDEFFTPAGSYHFKWARNGTRATYLGPVAVSTAASNKEKAILSAVSSYSNAPTDGSLLITRTADRYEGRQLENVFATDPLTLNVVDALYNRDEEGNTTPTRTISSNVDPLGNYEAMSVNWTNATHNLEQVNMGDDNADLSDLTVTMSTWMRSPSDTEDLGFGLTSRTASNYHVGTLSTTWTQVEGVNTLSPSTTDYGYIPQSGASVPFTAELYGTFIGMATGPMTVPENTVLRAEVMAKHAKAAFARPNSITLDNQGWMVSGAQDFDNVLMTLGKPAISSYTMGCWVDFSKSDYSASYVAAMAYLNTPETSTSTYHNEGAIGMDVSNYGRIYTQPNYARVVAQSPNVILNQGPVHLAIRVDGDGSSAVVTTYLNGVPIVETTESFSTINPEIVSLMGQQLGRSRRQDGTSQMQDGDRIADAFFYERAITEEELSEIYLAGVATVGDSASPSIMVLGSFDSLVAFSPSPFWDAIAAPELHPGVFGIVEAKGGSFYGSGSSTDYINADRQSLRRRQLKWSAKHFDLVIWMCQYGTNDIGGSGRIMDPVSGGSTQWETGRDTIDAMIFADIATVPSSYRSKIKTALVPVVPHGGWAAADADSNDILRNQTRLDYNADCRANYLTRGFDYLVDFEDYTSDSHGSLLLAAIDAYENGANNDFNSDGIHWVDSGTGGASAAAAVTIPFLAARLSELNN